MLHDTFLPADGGRIVRHAHGEAERSVVAYLIVAVAIGHDEPFAVHQSGRTTSERGPYLVAVESASVVVVVGGELFGEQGFVGLSLSLELFDDGMVGEFGLIALLHLQFGRVLHPYVYTEGAFLVALQGRPVDAVGRAVVLPRDVVYALGILPSADDRLKL